MGDRLEGQSTAISGNAPFTGHRFAWDIQIVFPDPNDVSTALYAFDCIAHPLLRLVASSGDALRQQGGFGGFGRSVSESGWNCLEFLTRFRHQRSASRPVSGIAPPSIPCHAGCAGLADGGARLSVQAVVLQRSICLSART